MATGDAGTALGASAAGQGAGIPLLPVALNAVLRARLAVAGSGVSKARADETTVLIVGGNIARASLGAAAAADGAIGAAGDVPIGPVASVTMDGAGPCVTFCCGATCGASSSTVCGGNHDNEYVIVSHSDTARDVATHVGFTEVNAAVRVHAVDRAMLGFTSAGGIFSGRAGSAAVTCVQEARSVRILEDRTGARHATTAAGKSACIPIAPITNLAVSGASLFLAGKNFLSDRALVAVFIWVGGDVARASHTATATSEGAIAPDLPVANIAVNGARAKVDVVGLRKIGAACFATKGGLSSHSPCPCLNTGGTANGVGPLGPSAHVAINGAVRSCAVPHSSTGRARSATVATKREGTVAGLGASTARVRAIGPTAPSTLEAVVGACCDGARGVAEEVAAGSTAVGVEVNEFALALHGTSATAFGTIAVFAPIAKCAIYRAEEFVAVPVFITVGTFRTTVQCIDVAPAPDLCAATACRGAGAIVP